MSDNLEEAFLRAFQQPATAWSQVDWNRVATLGLYFVEGDVASFVSLPYDGDGVLIGFFGSLGSGRAL